MFKGKAKFDGTGNELGAKLYLSLPLTNNANAANVWTEDSLSEIFSVYMLNMVNGMIVKETNVQNKNMMMQLILGISADTNTHPVVTSADHSGFTNWIITSPNVDPNLAGMTNWTYAFFTNWYAGLYTNQGNQSQINILNLVLSPSVTSQITNHGYTLSKTELETFVNRTNLPDSAKEMAASFKSINSMINPAYFSPTNGFIGTHNETTGVFYNFISNNLVEGSAPAIISILSNLNLSGVQAYVPKTVFESSITIE